MLYAMKRHFLAGERRAKRVLSSFAQFLRWRGERGKCEREKGEKNESGREWNAASEKIKMQQYERGNFGAQSGDRSLLQRRGRKQTRNTHKNSILGKQNRKKTYTSSEGNKFRIIVNQFSLFYPLPFCLAASLPWRAAHKLARVPRE